MTDEVTGEANRDGGTVPVRPRNGWRRRHTVLLVAGIVMIAAAVAVVVPLTMSRDADPADANVGPAPVTEQNILLVGVDDPRVDNGVSDTIALVRRTTDGSFHAMSIPRDAYATIPEYGTHKINSAYGRGSARIRDPDEAAVAGATLLVATVEALTGVKVDHFALIRHDVLAGIANRLGGVEVCLKAATTDPVAGADFPAGRQTLTGDAALAFLRQRHGLPNGDVDRMVRSRTFLRAFFAKLAGSRQPIPLTGGIQIDLAWNLVDFAGQVTADAPTTVASIPYDSAVKTTQEGNVVGVDPVTVQRFAADFLAGRGGSTGNDPCVW
jgi:LCP family protein required for cell wall assembly